MTVICSFGFRYLRWALADSSQSFEHVQNSHRSLPEWSFRYVSVLSVLIVFRLVAIRYMSILCPFFPDLKFDNRTWWWDKAHHPGYIAICPLFIRYSSVTCPWRGVSALLQSTFRSNRPPDLARVIYCFSAFKASMVSNHHDYMSRLTLYW